MEMGAGLLEASGWTEFKCDNMGWTTLDYSRDDVDRAGASLIRNAPLSEDAAAIIGNWRSAHSYPLNTFQMRLRYRARAAENQALVSQRLKRLSSISFKLQHMRRLKLSEMQDIAGCRVVAPSPAIVRSIVADYKRSRIQHELIDEDDYIESPKSSGYRSYHLIYSYYSDVFPVYNGLKVEVQIRSQLQHAWATAVETVGTFTGQALKSSAGSADWLRFFVLMGSEIARREKTPTVPGTPDDPKALKTELRELERSLDVCNRLGAYGTALKEVEETSVDAHYFLLHLDPEAHSVSITGYQRSALMQAQTDYLRAEELAIATNMLSDTVLVSVDAIGSLRRAYPNYFLDTTRFIQAVRTAVA